MSWLHGTAARLRLLFGRRTAESRMDEEIRFHVDMEAERLVREEQFAPDEARRRAMIARSAVSRGIARRFATDAGCRGSTE